MYEFEVVVVRNTFGRVMVKADGYEQAKEIACDSSDIEWNEPSDPEVVFVTKE
jgi:hypothetical protein